MDLKQIEYFVRVAELGSFTRAAVVLNIAQPALEPSGAPLLEVELRQNLLVRNGRGAIPTEAGKLLLEHGRGILHQVERAREELGQVRGALAGRVAIGLPTSVARVMTVPLTRAFRNELPEVRLSISEGLSGAILGGLNSGHLDLVVLYNAQPSRETDVAHLLDEDLVLVRARPPGLLEDPPPGPIALSEVAQLPWSSPPGRMRSACMWNQKWPRLAAPPRWRWRLMACLPSSTWWPMAQAAPCCRATRCSTRRAPRPTPRRPLARRRCALRCRWPPACSGHPPRCKRPRSIWCAERRRRCSSRAECARQRTPMRLVRGALAARDLVPHVVLAHGLAHGQALDFLEGLRVEHHHGAVHLPHAGQGVAPVPGELDVPSVLPGSRTLATTSSVRLSMMVRVSLPVGLIIESVQA